MSWPAYESADFLYLRPTYYHLDPAQPPNFRKTWPNVVGGGTEFHTCSNANGTRDCPDPMLPEQIVAWNVGDTQIVPSEGTMTLGDPPPPWIDFLAVGVFATGPTQQYTIGCGLPDIFGRPTCGPGAGGGEIERDEIDWQFAPFTDYDFDWESNHNPAAGDGFSARLLRNPSSGLAYTLEPANPLAQYLFTPDELQTFAVTVLADAHSVFLSFDFFAYPYSYVKGYGPPRRDTRIMTVL